MSTPTFPRIVLPTGETAYEKLAPQLIALQSGDMPLLLEKGGRG